MTDPISVLRAQGMPQIAERDTTVIKADLVTQFEALTGRTLYPAQTEMFVIEMMAYAISALATSQQLGAAQNRALFAEASHLDQLGANVGTYRLPAQAARCEVEFTLTEARPTSVVIPLGTRVAAGADLIFKTEGELVIAPGGTVGTVDTAAIATGARYNDLQLGQITDILDPVAYVGSVANVQISAGGSDIEDDERLRDRVLNAFERITRGGSRAGYAELVKAAHPDVVDVAVIRPEPGHIEIYPLTVNGIAPNAIDDVISAYLDPETRIPMGDYVTVQKVTEMPFDVVLTIKVIPGNAAAAQVSAESAIQALFATWATTLGAQIAPSAIVEAVRQVSGVVGVTGPAFAFTDLQPTEFATLNVLSVTMEDAPNV